MILSGASREMECNGMKIDTMKIKPLTVKNAATGQEMQVVDYPALLALDADVYLIFGMRSFGKSYGILQYCIDRWIETGAQFAVMRTIDEDVRQGRIRSYMATIKPYFEERTDQEKELSVLGASIDAKSIEDGRNVREKIGSALSLSQWLSYKGNNYDMVQTIIFEEFLERKKRLKDDLFLEGYLNNLSTIIRLRDNVKVFCLANTVKQKSPIFDYYHIDVSRVRRGKVTLFSEENGLRVCVYWTPEVKIDDSASKHYNVNQNKQAQMITGGEWEESEYPITWNGYTLDRAKELKRFRGEYSFYIFDLNLSVRLGDTVLIERPKSMKARRHAITAQEIALNYPGICRFIRNAVQTKNIITEADCFIDIDNFMDRTF